MRLEHDGQLHTAFRRGDHDALARVYREQVPALRLMLTRGFAFTSRGRKLRYRGCAPDDLDDIVQEVFARAFTEAARLAYDGQRPYRNYLFAIARNLVVQRARVATPRLLPYDELPARDELPSRSPSPDRAFEASRQLARLVQSLGPDERSLFELRLARRYSAERAATELGWSAYRVRRTEQRLRRMLARSLG
jgi:RNA polymerase sigma factor (sigma-70 family)